MDTKQYRVYGKDMVDYVAEYLETIRKRRVFPDVSPGYMRELVPDEAPEKGEKWEQIMADVERVIMPGMTHWQSPHMHAYFPATHSYPALLGDMLADGINAIGFTWASSPACTELEVIATDWLGKMIGLPAAFLHSDSQASGGGVLQTSASEATLVSMLAARTEAIQRLRNDSDVGSTCDCDVGSTCSDAIITSKLVAYCSEQAHSSVEKASLISLVKLRLLSTDDEHRLRGDALEKAIELDRQQGLIPFFVCATLGTTGCCSFDDVSEIGPICMRESIWLHIDAAYAGSAFVCPEYRSFMDGVEYAQSFAFNPSKWLLVNFDCTAMWVTTSGALHCTFNVEPLYLQHENSGAAVDYMHWQIPLSRRFRALKLWFVMRAYGVEGLQAHIRKNVELGEYFEKKVLADERFEVVAPRHLGLIVFRLKEGVNRTDRLLKNLNRDGRIHMVPASLKGVYVIRFTVTSPLTTEADLDRDWTIIQEHAAKLFAEENMNQLTESSVTPGKKKRHFTWAHHERDWDMGLLLSNVPVHPNVVNGSYAALCDTKDSTGKAMTTDDVCLVNIAEKSGLDSICFRQTPKMHCDGKLLARRVRSLDTGSKHLGGVDRKWHFDPVFSEPSCSNDSSAFSSSDSSDEDSDLSLRDLSASVSPTHTDCMQAKPTVAPKEKPTMIGSANRMFGKFAEGVLRKISLVVERKTAQKPAPSTAHEKQERNGKWGVDG